MPLTFLKRWLTPRRRPSRPHAKPALELLEDRLALAVEPFGSAVFQAQIQSMMREFKGAQMSLAVLHNDQIATYTATNHAYDFPADRPPTAVTPASVFRLGSVSKALTASAVMVLVQQGRIQLADSAFGLLGVTAGQVISGTDPLTGDPVSAAVPASLLDVTVYDLLHMISGLPTAIPANSMTFKPSGPNPVMSAFDQAPASYAALAFAGPPPYDQGIATTAQKLNYLLYTFGADPTLIQPPGTTYVYNNLNFDIAGMIVDRFSDGLGYAGFLQRFVFGPMGIEPPTAAPPSPALIGPGYTLFPYPTEVNYYSDPLDATGPSIYPDPAATTAPFYPPEPVPQAYGTFAVEGFTAAGGMVATPSALVRFIDSLTDAFLGTSTSGPLTQATVAQMLEKPSEAINWGGLGDGWFGIGLEVQPVSPGGDTPGKWSKGGNIDDSTLSSMQRDRDGLIYSAVWNGYASGRDGLDEGEGGDHMPMIVGDLIRQYVLGPAGLEVVSGTPQATVVGTNFAAPLQVRVVNGFNEPLPNIPVTFRLPTTGPGGSFLVSGQGLAAFTGRTNAQGVIEAPPIVANGAVGDFEVLVFVDNILYDGQPYNPEVFARFTLTNAAPPILAVGGSGGRVEVFNAAGQLLQKVKGFRGGNRVAVGDVNGDGLWDLIVGSGPGGRARVKVLLGPAFNPSSTYTPLAPRFAGGVNVASGDVNGDGFWDVIVGVAGGGSRVIVISGKTGGVLSDFTAFGRGSRSGVTVAAGDVNGDGLAEVVVGVAHGSPGPHVKVFDGNTGAELSAFRVSPRLRGGVWVAAGDVNGDHLAEIVTGSGVGSRPHVKVFSGAGTELESGLAFDRDFTDGVRVAVLTQAGSPLASILAAPASGGRRRVRLLNGITLQEAATFEVSETTEDGLFVAASGR